MNLKEGLDAFYAEVHKPRGTKPGLFGGTWKRPLDSVALSVHPSQVKEALEDAKKKGVSVEFKADGTAVFRSKKQYNAYCAAYGYFNRNLGQDGMFRGDAPERPDPVQEYGEAAVLLAGLEFQRRNKR